MQTGVERPRFRQDLVAEPIDDGAGKFIDVMDPDSGQLFRFYEVEYSLACAMDGERDVAGIVKWAEEELGLKPSANEVRTVVATLGDLGFLERGAEMAAAVNAAAAAAAVTSVETPRFEPAVEAPRAAAPAEAPRAAAPAASPPPRQQKTPPAGTPAVKQPAAAAAAAAAPPPRPTPPPPEARKPAATPPQGTERPTGLRKAVEPDAASFDRWDQPTAMGDPDDYLDAGVVPGKKRANTPVPDVELGRPGAHSIEVSDEVTSADFELGQGVVAAAATSARAGSNVELGAPGGGLSTDLAADMAISPNDVKEAVRASQVMRAVDVPPEYGAELEAPKKPTAAPVQTRPVSQPAPTEQRADPTPRPKPIELPTERPVLPKAPTAPSSGVSPILIALLVLAVLGAGGFLVYKYVIKKKDPAPAQSSTTPKTEPPKPAEPPPPPPVETAKLATEQVPPEDLKPSAANQVATIVATDTAVKAGDPIARLVGFKPAETALAAAQKEVDRLNNEITNGTKARTEAEAANNAAAASAADKKISAAEAALGLAEAKLIAATAALDKFLIKAPADGKVTAVAKANAKVTPTDIIATFTREPVLVVTFKSAGEAAVDSKVLLAVKDSDTKLSCTVVATGGDGTKIACPKDAAPEGTEVSFVGPDPAAAAPAEGDKPAEPPAGDKPADAPADKPAEPAGDKPAEPAADKPADPPADKPADKAPAPKAAPKRPPPRPRPQPKPAAPTDKPDEKPADKLFPPADKPADKPAELPKLE